jgi:hypothetical protein
VLHTAAISIDPSDFQCQFLAVAVRNYDYANAAFANHTSVEDLLFSSESNGSDPASCEASQAFPELFPSITRIADDGCVGLFT